MVMKALQGKFNTELQNPETSDKLNFNTYVNQNARNEYNLNLKHRFNDRFAVGLLSHMNFNPMKEDLNKDGFMDIPTGKQYNFLNKYAYNSGKGFEAQFGGGYLEDTRTGGQFLNIMDSTMTASSHGGGGIMADTALLYKIGITNKNGNSIVKQVLYFARNQEPVWVCNYRI